MIDVRSDDGIAAVDRRKRQGRRGAAHDEEKKMV